MIDSEKEGLGIGNMTSQVLAIFYLNDMDHYIKEKLKIKYYVRYQDDFILFHKSKEYLRNCLQSIEKFLLKEKLMLNVKSRIYSNSDNYIFLGRDKKGKYIRYRSIKRRIRKRKSMYNSNNISLISLCNTIISYKEIGKRLIYN